MMRTSPLVAGLCLVLAGCLSSGGPSSAGTESIEPVLSDVLSDPPGDAAVRGPTYARSNLVNSCSNVPTGELRDACWQAVEPVAGQEAPEGGIPEPSLDLLSLTFSETPSTLGVRFELGGLDETFSGWSPDEDTGGGIGACWLVGGDEEKGWECTYIYAYQDAGTLLVEQAFDRYTPDCNDWWWCSWNVPATFEFGSPATVTLSIPRPLLAGDGVGTVTRVEASSSSSSSSGSEMTPSYRFSAAGREESGTFGLRSSYTVDSTEETEYTFVVEAESSLSSTAVFDDSADDAARGEADILSASIEETEDALTLAVQLAEVAEAPMDHSLYVALGLAGTPVREMGYDVVGGEIFPWAGYCTDPEAEGCGWTEFEVGVDRVTGSPGWVRFTLPRAVFDDPAAGALVTLLFTATGYQDGPGMEEGPMGASYQVFLESGGDWTPPSPAYWLTMGAAP